MAKEISMIMLNKWIDLHKLHYHQVHHSMGSVH
jgi:hypothetical protein